MIKRYFLLFAAAAAILPFLAGAQVTVTGEQNNPDLSNIKFGIPGTHDPAVEGPAALVANAYEFALLIGGLLAFGSIVYGGVQYLITAGNHSAQGEAKERIRDALIGLLLLIGVYLVLNIINPDLTKLRFPTLERLQAPNQSTLADIYGSNPWVRSDPLGRVTAAKPDADIWSCQTNDSAATVKVCYATEAACNKDCEKYMDDNGVDADGLGPTDGKCVAAKANACPGIETIEEGQCKNGACVTIDLPWEFKNGNTADQAMVDTLKCAASKGVVLRITEAMPPSSPHKSQKHTNGCAVDATIPLVKTAADCSKICEVRDKLSQCGGAVLNEYYNLCGGAAACRGVNTEKSTADHIHITSCN